MNYRHAFHAGGFADVLKHIVLTRILLYLQGKPAAFRLIDTHLDIVRAFNPRGAELEAYPGSPLIARALLRPQDRLTACELEPKAHKKLVDTLRRDRQGRVVEVDGW